MSIARHLGPVPEDQPKAKEKTDVSRQGNPSPAGNPAQASDNGQGSAYAGAQGIDHDAITRQAISNANPLNPWAYLPPGAGGGLVGDLGNGGVNNWSGAGATTTFLCGPLLTFPRGGMQTQIMPMPMVPTVIAQEAKPAPTTKTVVPGEIIAWRAWRYEDGYLRSVYQPKRWIPGKPMTGKVRQGVGVHAAKTHDYAFSYCTAGTLWVVGQVSLWGEVVEHEWGYRAEFGAIHSIVSACSSIPAHKLQKLRLKYQTVDAPKDPKRLPTNMEPSDVSVLGPMLRMGLLASPLVLGPFHPEIIVPLALVAVAYFVARHIFDAIE